MSGLAAAAVTVEDEVERVMLSCSSAHAIFSNVSVFGF